MIGKIKWVWKWIFEKIVWIILELLICVKNILIDNVICSCKNDLFIKFEIEKIYNI